MLQTRSLSVEVGGRLTLDDATFAVQPGDIVGLVGRNGAGKTSLLKVLAGQAPVHGGSVHHVGRLGYLPQDPRIPAAGHDRTALEHVLSGRGLDDLITKVEKLRLAMEEDPSEAAVARYSRAHDEFERVGGYAAESEVRRTTAGLGVAPDRLDLPLRVLSGGERRRVELARILFAGSDVLLLDEPTNHLDTDAKSWLLSFLRSYRGALIVVSHDLELLDEAITRVLHLDEGKIVEYRGTYTQYRAARARDEARLTKVAAAQKAEVHRLSSLADSMRGQTQKRARTAKTLDHRVERLQAEAISGPTKERQLQLKLPEPPHSGRTVLEVEGLAKSYGDQPVFNDINFDVGRRERLLIMGLNGAGKTSLLRIIAGESIADEGDVRFGLDVSAGYYAQEHEGLVAGESVLWHLQRSAAGALSDQNLRSLLGMFGLPGEFAHQDADTLSGGEKTKLSLAQLVAGRHNLLLLDEPTNNLDPGSRDAITAALRSWTGTMVLVSHDADFVRDLAPDRVLIMPDGDLDFWREEHLDLVAMA